MKKCLLLLFAVSLISNLVNAQAFHFLPDHPGKFENPDRTNYGFTQLGFTKAVVDASDESIREIVNVLRQNPVLADIKGFNGRAVISAPYSTCKGKDWYGVPSILSIEFLEYFSRNGQVNYNRIEPPHWDLCVNDIVTAGVDYFSASKCYFTVPLKKETIEPGIDVYDGEIWVLYDPSRPPYWIPVTIEEAFSCAYEEIRNTKDELTARMMKEMVDGEYAAIPESDRKKQAYFGGNMSRVSPASGFGDQDNLFPYIMKVNPEYWNKNLPKSAIQFIWFNSCQSASCKEYQKKQLDNCMKDPGSGSGCDVIRFNLAFSLNDIRNLAGLIEK